MQIVQVYASSHHYPIYIGHGLLNDFSLFEPYISKRAAIITNTTVAPLYLNNLIKLFKNNNIDVFSIILPDGEQYKNYESLNQIYNALLQNHADRQTAILALGGGVIGDCAGFAAATYQRGVPLIQIPTTLLSQVDSSVGGKTAINHALGKNMIGAFYQPRLVVADLDTLKTLPKREFSAGMAEVIKYALLGDIHFFQFLEQHIEKIMAGNEDLLVKIVMHCCQMKANIVAEDETEQGVRAYLNLGHTFGHAIEAQMGYGNWLHGEAVAAGMVLAGRLSKYLGYLSDDDITRIVQLLRQANLPEKEPNFPFTQWLKHIKHDKKAKNGQMRFISLKRLGEAQMSVIDNEQILHQVLAK